MGVGSFSGEKIEIRSAEDEVDVENNEEVEDDDDYEEESEEAWRARREGSTQSKLDAIKRMLAVAFFAGLGIIVIVVAFTAAPLVTPNPEDMKNSSIADILKAPGPD